MYEVNLKCTHLCLVVIYYHFLFDKRLVHIEAERFEADCLLAIYHDYDFLRTCFLKEHHLIKVAVQPATHLTVKCGSNL